MYKLLMSCWWKTVYVIKTLVVADIRTTLVNHSQLVDVCCSSKGSMMQQLGKLGFVKKYVECKKYFSQNYLQFLHFKLFLLEPAKLTFLPQSLLFLEFFSCQTFFLLLVSTNSRYRLKMQKSSKNLSLNSVVWI